MKKDQFCLIQLNGNICGNAMLKVSTKSWNLGKKKKKKKYVHICGNITTFTFLQNLWAFLIYSIVNFKIVVNYREKLIVTRKYVNLLFWFVNIARNKVFSQNENLKKQLYL